MRYSSVAAVFVLVFVGTILFYPFPKIEILHTSHKIHPYLRVDRNVQTCHSWEVNSVTGDRQFECRYGRDYSLVVEEKEKFICCEFDNLKPWGDGTPFLDWCLCK